MIDLNFRRLILRLYTASINTLKIKKYTHIVMFIFIINNMKDVSVACDIYIYNHIRIIGRCFNDTFLFMIVNF